MPRKYRRTNSTLRSVDMVIKKSERSLVNWYIINNAEVRIWRVLLAGIFIAGFASAIAFVAGFTSQSDFDVEDEFLSNTQDEDIGISE